MRRWVEVVGEAMAQRSQPERYENGTVYVAVEGAAWAQELRMSKDKILEKLRALSNEPQMFREVRFGVRSVKHEPTKPSEAEKDAFRATLESMTIQEITARRLKAWKHDGAD
jgi:predicted nucleic acid-binding Zn ribbon protein